MPISMPISQLPGKVAEPWERDKICTSALESALKAEADPGFVGP